MPDFDKLEHHVSKLQSLLNDRCPGLSTWPSLISFHWRAIAEMWSDPLSVEEIERLILEALNGPLRTTVEVCNCAGDRMFLAKALAEIIVARRR